MTSYVYKNHKKINIVADSTSNPILVTPGVSPVSVAIHPQSSAVVSYTLSSREDIANNVANWIEWDAGSVSTNTAKVFVGPITAFRGTAIGGDAILEIIY